MVIHISPGMVFRGLERIRDFVCTARHLFRHGIDHISHYLRYAQVQDLDCVRADICQQVLWSHARAIAEAYPAHQRERYRTAAATLRIPYWDWAIHPALPDAATQPYIQVNTPFGIQDIQNPLYQYVFHPDAAGNGFPPSNPVSSIDHLLQGQTEGVPVGKHAYDCSLVESDYTGK